MQCNAKNVKLFHELKIRRIFQFSSILFLKIFLEFIFLAIIEKKKHLKRFFFFKEMVPSILKSYPFFFLIANFHLFFIFFLNFSSK